MKYVCELCGYIYDETAGQPGKGIIPGTAFGQLPEDYECPGCGSEREAFDPVRPLTGLQTQSHSKRLLRR